MYTIFLSYAIYLFHLKSRTSPQPLHKNLYFTQFEYLVVQLSTIKSSILLMFRYISSHFGMYIETIYKVRVHLVVLLRYVYSRSLWGYCVCIFMCSRKPLTNFVYSYMYGKLSYRIFHFRLPLLGLYINLAFCSVTGAM